LHTLDLSHNSSLSPAGWQAFGKTRAFPALTRVQMEDGVLSATGAEELAGATGFTLRVLQIQMCGAGPGIGAALAAAPWAGSLRVLDLSSNALEPADVKTLAACKKFRALRHLNLSNNALGPTGLSALTANPAFRGLRALDLSGRPHDNRGLAPTHFDRFLAKLDVPDLHRLDLSGRPVGAKAARRLTDPRFASLTRLGLNGCKLTDPSAAALVTAPALANLIQLDLINNRLATGPEVLSDRTVLPRLASCLLTDNVIPAPVARKLRRRPGVRV
jgi:hypothetical protein